MRLRLSIMLLSGLMLAGCSPVFVDEPIGKQVELDMEQVEKIEGRWRAGASLFEVKHLDGSRFKITKIETDPEKTKEKSTTAIVTQTDKEHTYFHIKETDDAERYMLLRLGFTGGKGSEYPGEVVLYMANVRSFAKAVEAGKLKGTIGRNDDKPETVKLSSSTAEIEAWLQNQENEPFVLGHVFVARKVKKDN